MTLRTRLIASKADARVQLVTLDHSAEDQSPPSTPVQKSPNRKRSASDSPAKSPSPKKAFKLDLDVPVDPPARWRECLDVLSAQRATIVSSSINIRSFMPHAD